MFFYWSNSLDLKVQHRKDCVIQHNNTGQNAKLVKGIRDLVLETERLITYERLDERY